MFLAFEDSSGAEVYINLSKIVTLRVVVSESHGDTLAYRDLEISDLQGNVKRYSHVRGEISSVQPEYLDFYDQNEADEGEESDAAILDYDIKESETYKKAVREISGEDAGSESGHLANQP